MAIPEKSEITPNIEKVSDWRAEMDADAGRQKEPKFEEKIGQAIIEANHDLRGARFQLTEDELDIAREVAKKLKRKK